MWVCRGGIHIGLYLKPVTSSEKLGAESTNLMELEVPEGACGKTDNL
jgi:hypothetical protein